MTKILFSTVAAAAVLATSAMAFDNIDNGTNGIGYDFNNSSSAVANSAITIATAGQQGDGLIFPAFLANGTWQSTVRVINTSSTTAVVAKVVLYAGSDSIELRDFNIYLSANDVWEGTIKVDTDGAVKLFSTDGSSPLTSGSMASTTTPMISDAITVTKGYIQVIGCAATTSNSGAHGDHANLRSAYNEAAARVRGTAGTTVVFSNGVITSGATVPGVNTNYLATGSILGTSSVLTTRTYSFIDVPDVLAGDIRITDTVAGKDMVMPAVVLRGVTDATSSNNALDNVPMALMFVEGEAANIADRNLVPDNAAAGTNVVTSAAGIGVAAATAKSEYSYANVLADAQTFNVSNVFMHYGDSASTVDNMLLSTNPFKRILVNTDANIAATGAVTSYHTATTPTIGSIFTGTTSSAGAISDYGKYSALALIYDQDENQASASQFSPANTPTMNFAYELSVTEGNTASTDNLSTYLAQSGFTKGFTKLQFRLGTGAAGAIPVIPTQMIATDVSGKIVTNWITPTWN